MHLASTTRQQCTKVRNLERALNAVMNQSMKFQREQSKKHRSNIAKGLKIFWIYLYLVYFCIRNKKALRGHRDHVRFELGLIAHDGLFGDDLKHRLRSASSEVQLSFLEIVTYRSPAIQNELIDFLEQGTLKHEMVADNHFSIITDETLNANVQEQLSLSLRFIHDKVHERFIAVVGLCAMTGEYMNRSYLDYLRQNGFLVENFRGQLIMERAPCQAETIEFRLTYKEFVH